MNRERFIEQLNLYLDNELPEEESVELRDAIRRNPDFHRIYLQYCQLFNACSQLGDEFSEKQVSIGWRQKVYALGGMAAAFALLGLAVQNLAPFINLDAHGTDTLEGLASAEPLNASFDSEPLVVLDVNQLREEFSWEHSSIERASYDLDSVFKPQVEQATFSTPTTVEYASFEVSDVERPDLRWKREFAFGNAIRSSTFEHEALIAGEESERSFSKAVIGAASHDGQTSEVRFDLTGAASTLAKEPRR